MKKKMIIYMSKLSVGGMEKALLNLINYSNFTKNYDVTIYTLYSQEEKYLEDLKTKTKVKLLWSNKWNAIGKLICTVKILFDLIKLKTFKYQYDVAICYPYQHPVLSALARNASNNNIIFIHNNLEQKYEENAEKHSKKMKFNKFRKVVCVSEDAKKSFMNLHPNYNGICEVIHNYIDGDEIIRKSKEKTNEKFISKDSTIFINIARHEEKSKKISRIIKASHKLILDGYKFKVLLIGEGEDTNYYRTLIDKYNLKNNIYILGKKINPYPYLKQSNCFVLSSQYEGYGIVLDEARILDKPIVTTDVADAKKIVDDGYGILCENSDNGIYCGMKKFLEEGYKLNSKFDYKQFNKEITKLLDQIVK